jgi:HSP20 family protein
MERPFGSLLERFFDDPFFTRLPAETERAPWTPVNISEDEHAYRVAVEVPGMDEQDINVQVMGNQLLISGEKRLERKSGDGDWRCVECEYGSFQRSIPLPANLETEAIDAVYDRGILTLTIPKTNPTPSRSVKIRRQDGHSQQQQQAQQQQARQEEGNGGQRQRGDRSAGSGARSAKQQQQGESP